MEKWLAPLDMRHTKRQNFIFVWICILVSLGIQCAKLFVLPVKYFYDALTVQQLMTETLKFGISDSYANTALFFQWLGQMFDMDSIFAGGLVVWALCIPFAAWLALRYLQDTWEHYLLLGTFSVLLPVFVWSMQKEALQFFFFMVLLGGILVAPEEDWRTDVMVVLMLALWSFLFRSYYIVIAAGAGFFLSLCHVPWENMAAKKKRRVLWGLFLLLVAGFLMIALIWPNQLITLFDGRMVVNRTRENDQDANTIILDIIANPEQSLPLYGVNYLLAALRMMFPLELIFKGVQYFPFVVAQVACTVLLGRCVFSVLRGTWKGGQKEKKILMFLVAWYLVSYLFEPDFGSFIRHQAAAYPLLYPVLARGIEKTS